MLIEFEASDRTELEKWFVAQKLHFDWILRIEFESVDGDTIFTQINVKGVHVSDYKHPEVLVSTEWAAKHRNDPTIRLVEVDVDTTAYDQGHIPGAVGWNWQTQLQDNIRRDLIQKSSLEELLGKSGIRNDTTILLYGDNNNWFAAYAFWQLKYYGHKDVRLIDGGRKKWIQSVRSQPRCHKSHQFPIVLANRMSLSAHTKSGSLPSSIRTMAPNWWMCGQ